MIYAIVHADKEWGIGKGNDMMFSLPKDMKFFRETTMGHTVVMGGNTLRSFPGQKPLKNRVNIVLSRGQVCDECVCVRNFEELKAEMKRRENEEIYVIGGGVIYKELLPYCHEVLVTKVSKRLQQSAATPLSVFLSFYPTNQRSTSIDCNRRYIK